MTKQRFFRPEELSAIRAACDWRRLLTGLGVRADVRRCTDTEFWGYSPFRPEEQTASFHMKAPGLWYCWSSHATAPGRSKPGGGVIELVQAIHATRGQILKLNEAAAWLVDRGYCHLDESEKAAPAPVPAATVPNEGTKRNRPIDTDLLPRLTEHGTHPEFLARGISAKTCWYLRCGYLPGKRGTLAGRLVFQVGGVDDDGTTRVILSHIGRAVTPEQETAGKWRFYRGFNPSLELYNLDNLLLDQEAQKQTADTGTILLVEGAFDVAKCVEAGIKNVVATFGARLSEWQADKLKEALARLSASRVVIFYDRDQAGSQATADAVALLGSLGVPVTPFDWSQHFQSAGRQGVPIPETIQDPCDFSAAQLRWLRERKIV